MKIIDFEKKGNVVRFYLGDDDCIDYWGDDWDDAPYEYNASQVYQRYIKGYKDLVFPFDSAVFQPCDGEWNSEWSKEDMMQRKVPCICVLDKEYQDENTWYTGFKDICNHANTKKFYFGDHIDDAIDYYKDYLVKDIALYIKKEYRDNE